MKHQSEKDANFNSIVVETELISPKYEHIERELYNIFFLKQQ